jgi:formiminoglutamase
MNLQSFFNPIPNHLFQQVYKPNAFFNILDFHGNEFPEMEGIQIALIGLTEKRGISNNESIERGALEIREKLYHLKKGQVSNKIADLGDLINGNTLEETYNHLKTVCEFLIQQQILPVLFGGTHDLDIGQYLGYQNLDKLVSLLTIDAKVDMEEEGQPVETHSQDIILHQPNFLFNYTHLAYQSFLTDATLINVLEKLHFDHVRLGNIKDNIHEIEPLIRNADLVSIDINAIQSADAPGAADAQVFGLSAEQACLLSKFSGANEKLSSFGIYGYQPYYDDNRNKTASVVATMIWYFIEGFYERKDNLSFKSVDYIKYSVAMDNHPSLMIFYKSIRSEKWWMEIPQPEAGKFERYSIIPCSYQDYLLAQSGEVPERWINAQLKLF